MNGKEKVDKVEVVAKKTGQLNKEELYNYAVNSKVIRQLNEQGFIQYVLVIEIPFGLQEVAEDVMNRVIVEG